MQKVKFKAVGTALVSDIDAMNANTRRYLGRKWDPQLRAYVPVDNYPAVAFHAEYLDAVRSGDLEPADEETAKLCGVSFKKLSK